MTNIVDANYYSKNSEFQKKIATELFRYHSFKSHNENILDIGCGDGAITELLSQHGTVTGIDSSKSMIEYATNNHLNRNIQYEHTPILSYDTQQRYSLITAFNSIYWCGDLIQIFNRIKQLLKPKGKFLIVTYPKESPYWIPIIKTLNSQKWVQYKNSSISKNWKSSDEYLELMRSTDLKIISFDASEECISYNSPAEYARYLKGWIPLLFNNNKFPIDQFIADVVNTLWHNSGNEPLKIAYKKVALYGEKQE